LPLWCGWPPLEHGSSRVLLGTHGSAAKHQQAHRNDQALNMMGNTAVASNCQTLEHMSLIMTKHVMPNHQQLPSVPHPFLAPLPPSPPAP
jgi:hypothetical protein